MFVRLFVYGTLRRGEPNAGFLRHARWLGTARTAPGFALVDCEAYPALVAEGSGAVVGELCEVDAQTLADVDRLEGHPDLFRRVAIPLADGEPAQAYVMDAARVRSLPRIPSGDWQQARPPGRC